LGALGGNFAPILPFFVFLALILIVVSLVVRVVVIRRF
jgi:hypothetical protein